MFPLALEDAPTHIQETRPGQNSQRQAQTPDRQVLEGIQVCTARPLQIPGQVGVTMRLHTLLGDILQPLFIRCDDAAESVRLENTEREKSSDAAND